MLTAKVGRAGPCRRCLLVAAVAVGAMGASAAPALAAAQWGITMTHANGYGTGGGSDPYARSGKTFARESAGNTYKITVTNMGLATTTGPVEVVDELPAGIVLFGSIVSAEPPQAEKEQVEVVHGPEFSAPEGQCTTGGASEGIIGASEVKCSTSKELAPGQSYMPITLEVYVSPQAAPPSTNVATLTNVARVSGDGGVSETTKKEGETTITPAVPFGLASFITNVGELESPFGEPSLANPLKQQQQAGGHPYRYTTEFVLNYTTSSTGGLNGASGGPKELQVELPPGFLGDPQNTPRCPLKLFDTSTQACPSDTAVGYIRARLEGRLANGKAVVLTEEGLVGKESLLYNVVPAPGHAAALGFGIDKGIPFLLEGQVRSGGDYGVTVGDNANSNSPRPLGGQVITCENGAIELSQTNHVCNAAPEGSKPFLTNPTECSGPAPVTTFRTDSWDEPAGYASMEAYANAPSAQHYSEANGPPTKGTPVESSFVKGCDKLQFNPKVEFKPSPSSEGGTSQADEPTGMTLDLKVPQTNEVKALATPEVKNVEMALPKEMTASPSAADGLQACTKAQFWPPENGAEPAEHREPAVPAKCPQASTIGTVEVFTPLLSGAPVAEGALGVRGDLTCLQGDWSGGPWSHSPEQLEGGVEELENGNHERLKLSYQWLRNGNTIATGREYAVVPADEGQAVQCQVTATNGGGSSVAASRAAVGGRLQNPAEEEKLRNEGKLPKEEELRKEGKPTASPLPPASIAAPSGTPSTGNTLTCESGAWAESPTSFTYEWLRNGTPISGAGSGPTAATSFTYTLKPEDEAKVIQCQVAGTNEVVGTKAVVVADSAAVVVPSVPSPPPPLPGGALQGQVFQGEPECSPCTSQDAAEGKLLPLFIQAQSPQAGVIVKLHGKTKADPATGQLTSVFEEQPQQPFELFQLKLKGGPRAPLANPQSCGTATTTADLTPWSAPGLGGPSGTEPIAGTPDAHPSSSFEVGAGEPCPSTLPFAPTFNAGTTGPTATAAGVSTDFSVTFGRHDREQDLSGFQMHMPLGLVGKIPAVKECGEAEVNAAKENKGECPAESEIGTATSVAGPGPDPFSTHGHVYLTGPYNGAPFGLAVVTLAKAGPFNLGNVVVRSAITINPNTAAVTVTSDPLPQIVSGVPIRLREVHVDVTKQGFMLNPTNCSQQQVSATLGGAEGGGAQVSSPFGITGCKSLPFKPTFTASTQAHTSKANGASLDVKITYPQGAYANIAKTVTDLPAVLPSRLTTLQKACVDAVFEANPAACPEGSVVGQAIAHTPVLNQPLVGPAYLVSHGGAAFPDLEIVLQGEGVKVVLDGQTDIKKGVTITTFNAVPDSPVSTFEVNLPEGPHSALAANGELCSKTLNLPTELTGQNGAVIKQTTHIAVTGCPPTVSIAKTKLIGNVLLVTVKTSAKGTVKISGKGLKTITKKNLKAGTNQIRVALTKAGKSLRAHHKKTSVRISLTVGKQAVAKASTVRL
jgi:hypothetical protein